MTEHRRCDRRARSPGCARRGLDIHDVSVSGIAVVTPNFVSANRFPVLLRFRSGLRFRCAHDAANHISNLVTRIAHFKLKLPPFKRHQHVPELVPLNAATVYDDCTRKSSLPSNSILPRTVSSMICNPRSVSRMWMTASERRIFSISFPSKTN